MYYWTLLHILLCCFSEVTLGQFSATSSKTLLLHSQFSLLHLPPALRGVTECWPGLVIFNHAVNFAVCLVWHLQQLSRTITMKSVEYSGLQQHSGETSAHPHLIIHGGQSLITYSSSRSYTFCTVLPPMAGFRIHHTHSSFWSSLHSCRPLERAAHPSSPMRLSESL